MPVFAQNAARIYIKRVIRLAICAKGKGVQFYLHAEAQIFIRARSLLHSSKTAYFFLLTEGGKGRGRFGFISWSR